VSLTLSSSEILLLGALAGLTIFIGLPMGRVQNVGHGVKAFFAATATGILLFLFWDVLKQAIEPIERALEGGQDSRFVGLSALALGGFTVGLMSLVYYDGWMKRKRNQAMLGPGAASAAEFEQSWAASLSASAWLSLLIATGIGLHNFSEGLAIGQAGAAGEISLAVVLIIGFGLHNATEGFGIVAPLSGEPVRPSWRFLLLLGLIGGGPTFVGTLIGQAWVSEALSTFFLSLAAGSILFVVLELAAVNRRMASKQFVAWFVLLGLLLGFATEFVVEAAGV
jgi:ZIP family zinc transporter